MKEDVFVGVDIGGTSIKIEFDNEDCTILKKWEIVTDKNEPFSVIIQNIWDCIIKKKENLLRDLIAIGVGSAGFIHAKTGFIYEAVNIGWKNIPIGEELAKISQLPVFVENDANIATLGEVWQGAASGEEHVIMITLGTGVGGGIVDNHEILSGENGTAGEIGHMIVDPEGYKCNCGRIGCLETITSATGIVRLAKEKIKEFTDRKSTRLNSRHQKITAKDIFEFARNGDDASLSIIEKVGDVLGLTIANLGVIVNPSLRSEERRVGKDCKCGW